MQKPKDLKPTKNLVGSWVFNQDESDDPRSIMRADRGTGGGGSQSGGGMGGGYPGGGGGWGGRRGGGGMRGGQNDSDRQKMRDLLRPAQSLAIVKKDGEIDVNDDQNRKSEFYTDGRKIEKSKDPDNQPFAAKWEDYRLVAEEKGPHGNKIERSLEISPSTGQLYETLQFTMGRENRQVTLRYVYDPAGTGQTPGAAQQ
ncbi:MAG TPA: hypothetical protein VLX32_10840 [Candidatus Acidoferrum sp.]|nr:hypothetical protein [Candidatus Acidoferrum sp.]